MVKAHLDESRLVIWVLSFHGAVTASGQGARAQGASGKSCWVHGVYIPYWCVCAIPYTYWGVAGCGQGVAPGASPTSPLPTPWWPRFPAAQGMQSLAACQQQQRLFFPG